MASIVFMGIVLFLGFAAEPVTAYGNAHGDITPPTISSPENVTMTEGTTGRTIIWVCSDDNPYGYVIFNNGTISDYGAWDTSPIEIVFELDGLGVGIHNITVVVRDMAGNMSFDTVWVTVTSAEPAPFFNLTSMDYLLAVGILGGITVIVIIALRRKRLTA